MAVIANRPFTPLPGLEELWAETLGDPRIKIAILDGPYDRGHNCFKGADLHLHPSYLENPCLDGPALRHGTHIASIIFGQPGTSVAGLAPRCCGLVVPVFSDGPEGTLRSCSQLDLARAIIQAIDAGAHVISISAGELSTTREPEEHLRTAIETCVKQNILIVAAAGNDGCACLHIPAAVHSVLAVGAMDSAGLPMEMSNWGEAYCDQGILAPGDNILGASPREQTTRGSGTSFSTALVAGVAALLLSLQVRHLSLPDPSIVREALLANSLACDLNDESACRRFLAGRLDIRRTLASLRKTFAGAFPSSVGHLALPVGGATPAASHERARVLLSSDTNLFTQGATSMDKEVFDQSDNRQRPNDTAVSAASAPAPPNDPHTAISPKSSGITPSCGSGGCSCGRAGGGCSCEGKCVEPSKPALVYVLGLLGHDFQTEARRDSLLASPHKPSHPEELTWHSLLDSLGSTPDAPDLSPKAAAITWILLQNQTPIYAIQPSGAFASDAYKALVNTIRGQSKDKDQHVAIAGYLFGQTATLLSGQRVPVITPEYRGGGEFDSWTVDKLVKHLRNGKKEIKPKAGESKTGTEPPTTDAALLQFLNRVYYSLRNLGVLPQDRAINYAATNIYQAGVVFTSAFESGLKLDKIGVSRSPICRPGSDCWDVTLTFFDPEKMFQRARHVYQYTIDVSDVIPVPVGDVHDWDIYLSGV